MPHALLLHGSQEVDKLGFARELSQSLLCRSPDMNTGAPCGHCQGCELYRAGTHGDYIEVGLLEVVDRGVIEDVSIQIGTDDL